MGISHDYHSTGRSRRGGPGGVIRFAGAVAGILLVSFAITAILEHGQAQPEELPTVTANGTAQNILAPLPMQGAADSTTDSAVSGGENAAADGTPAVTLEQFGPARQTAGAYSVKAYDSSVIRQPASGQVDLSYFSDAAFLGDSLTVGFSDYKINLGGALICGYTGVGPDAIVNRSAVKSSVRGEEVALDVLAAAQPKKLYILLGTNTLTTVGAADRFLAYYGQMLDVLRQTLGEDCVIYVESIPPVRPEAAAEKPGLASDIIRSVNEQLALLAAAQPKKLYILLGTNTLTTVGAADRFLAYYGQMLDVLRQTLGEDCVIYVESIPPVRPEAAAEKPGLASDIIRSVNEQLALLAADKGCVYLDLWETLADGEGNLKEVLAAPDGVHFSAGNGYGAWVTYLRNHAKYSADNAWTPGSAYAG